MQIRAKLERLFDQIQIRIVHHIKFVRITYSLIAIAFAIYTGKTIERIAGNLSPEAEVMVRHLISYIEYVIYIFVAIFMLQLLYLIGDVLFGPKDVVPPPGKEKERVFYGYPSETYPNLDRLISLATKAFQGDTMSRDIVHWALRSGCALGLCVKDSIGNDVGFFDFYHPRKDVLDQWVAGTLSEKHLKQEDFEPIDAAAVRGDKEIHLFVGAMLLNTGNSAFDFHLSPLVVMAAKQYLRRRLIKYQKVVLYASIFANAGRRYAQLEKFVLHMHGEDRGPAGGGHDVYRTSFATHEPETQFVTVSRDNVYLLQVET